MKDKIRFAILGYGNIGKRYAEIISEMPAARLVAFIDVAFSKADAQASPAIFNNLADFFKTDIKCDMIIVATPNGLHFEHSAQCLKAGAHVLVEKPVALKTSQIEQLIALTKQTGRFLFPVWQIRYSPIIKALKELISTGTAGKVFWLQADCFWNRGEAYYHGHSWHGTLKMDGGPLFTQFSHVIDLLSWFCTDIKIQDSSFYKIRAELQTEFEDSGVINFKLKDKGVALLSYTTSAPPGTSSNELTIITEKAKIQLSGKYFETLMLLQTDESGIRDRIASIAAKQIDDIARYCTEELIEQVISALDDPNKENEQDLYAATSIIEEVYKYRSMPAASRSYR